MIKDSINKDLKQAMLSGDKNLVSVLRTIKSVILDAEISSGSRDTGLDEETVIAILIKESKKRQDASRLYLEAGDTERHNAERQESEIIAKYLPQMMSESEIEAIAKNIISNMGEGVGMQQMGQVIGQVKSKTGALADGSTVASIVKKLLS